MTNYNQRNPIFSFRLTDYRRSKLDKLAKMEKISANEFVRNIIDKYLANELTEKTDNKQERLMDLRIKKLEAEIKYMEIKNNFAENFGAPLSHSATRMLKPQIIEKSIQQEIVNESKQISPYDNTNKRLQCTECGILFCWVSYEEYNSQLTEFQRHLLAKHGRQMNELEKDVITWISYEGASIGY